METNDTQIDFLIRRYASESGVSARSEHLDADELNAFAEGKLPIAARSRYVSHLADCRDCRRLATQLSLSAGAVSKVDVAASEEIPQSWWRRLNIFLAPPAIRYAAFAMVVLIAAGIAFVTFRRPNPPANDLVAESGAPETSVSALKPSNASASPVNQVAKSAATPLAGNSQQSSSSNLDQKGYQPNNEIASSPPPPKPTAETSEVTKAAGLAERKATSPLEQTPSYAPPPPAETERAQNTARAQQSLSRTAPSGIEKDDTYNKYKVLDRSRSGETAKDREEDRVRASRNAPASKEDNRDEQAKNSRRDRNANTSAGAVDLRMETNSTPPPAKSEESSQVRAVGGRKFKRQGGVWIDVKYKSSMSLHDVPRGSEAFGALDSGLRSIAQQLSGEVVVVWKGKAFRIR